MPTLLALESSCDETSAALIRDGKLISHVVRAQLQHSAYGGVIPELASRLHQQHIVRVTQEALGRSGLAFSELDGIAVTQGPGLMGALLVGVSFAKGLAYALGIPLIGVNHMEAHVLANFLQDPAPSFPFLCLTVSGGHTQLVRVDGPLEMALLGETADDAAGEALDKAAKLLGLPYPGGPEIDRLARSGNPDAFRFPDPSTPRFSFSFSGLKTSLLYLIRDRSKTEPDFAEARKADLSASYQRQVVSILLDRLEDAARAQGIRHLALAGGVSANSELRQRFQELCEKKGWQAYVPPFEYCTDNAAMIAMAGHFRFLAGRFDTLEMAPFARGEEA
jgi:N6-L-threonylcarbamoyladenine synthase